MIPPDVDGCHYLVLHPQQYEHLAVMTPREKWRQEYRLYRTRRKGLLTAEEIDGLAGAWSGVILGATDPC